MDEETKKILGDYDKRLQRVEEILFSAKKVVAMKKPSSGGLALLATLKAEGFFSQERTPKEILVRLSEKGNIYKRVESLTDPLLRATQAGILNRKKGSKGWVYYA